MKQTECLLAEAPGLGRVYDCGSCGCVHLSVGPVNMTLTPEAYLQFVAMVHTSASNFEIWLEHKRTAHEPAAPL